MPAVSVTWRNSILAGILGPGRATGSPDSYIYRLWQDVPVGISPVEADWDGYTPPEWPADDWQTPDGAEILTDGLLDFGVPTGPSTDAVRYWSKHYADTDELLYWSLLDTRIIVRDSDVGGDPIQMELSIPLDGTA